MENKILEINNLTIAFKQDGVVKNAVEALSFSLNKGTIVGIVGESGSGKSLTSLTTMRLLPENAIIKSGTISFWGKEKLNVLEASEKEMQNVRGKEIAMIFQEPMTSLNPVMKCGEQVAEVLRKHFGLSKSAARVKAIDWFKEVLLPRENEIYESYPHQLSGGQKQRVMIAMAMCCEPKLLIADEPTTALDVTVQKKILQLIKDLQQKHNMSVIFITHDLGVVAEIADKVVVMNRGKKVEENSCEEIFKFPKDRYTKGLLACRPPLEYRLRKLPTVKDFLSEEPVIQTKVSNIERKEELDELFDRKRILEVKNLETFFPIQKGIFKRTVDHVKAVNNVSFDVYEGETLGLVGESGCGKTTLGRSILRLVEPTAGEVYYNGTELRKLSMNQMREHRRNLQIIFQDPYSSLNPKMRVGKAIMEPMQVHNIGESDIYRKEKVIDLMETVGLNANQFNRFPHEFSGGQRQRICIARALALQPKFIICDESVSALDVSVQAQVLNLLNELKEKFRFTYIFISHDLSVVKYMSDRMIVMKEGRIEEMGIAEDVYQNPKTDYTKKLIDSIPKVSFA